VSFKDHFSGHAAEYARNRPGYPAELFAWLAEVAPSGERALDCGTGSGQAAVRLAEHFAQVVATDPSAEQVGNAQPHPRVSYRVAPAEATGLAGESVDLVTVAQALHWFDLPRFWAEVDRVLRPGGVLAVWTYWLMHVSPEVDAAVERFYTGEIGPYWPPERAMVDEGYRSIAFPYAAVEPPAFHMGLEWTVEQALAYLRTWSGVKAFQRAHGRDPLLAAEPDIRAAWGDPDAPRPVRWPLSVRAVRKPATRP
jgi:SAM-dependent methyltransferase